jgi:transposase
LPAAVIAALYKQRWQVELFFKWIKTKLAHPSLLRHLRKRQGCSTLYIETVKQHRSPI